MLYQNASSGDLIIVIIALVAMVVFILMSRAAWLIIRPVARTKNEARPKKEQASKLTLVAPASGKFDK